MLIKVINAYDAWAEKSMHGKTYEDIIRITNIISESGEIEYVFDKVDKKNHTLKILKTFGRINSFWATNYLFLSIIF
jgi:peroxiredoxin